MHSRLDVRISRVAVGRRMVYSPRRGKVRKWKFYPMRKTGTEMENPADGQEPLAPVEPGTVTPEQLAELKDRAAKADEHWERLLRTTADLDNYKKRAAREKQDAIKFANESLLQKLIPVLDNFDMALAAAQQGQAGAAQSLQAGVAMVAQQFKSALAEAGLEEIDAAGQPFDPNLHEAVSEKETRDAPEGQVVQQMRKGYKLRDRLLRPASVVVAKRPAS
jgi:molecular chaperone GrpE